MFTSVFRLFTFGMILSTMVLVSCEKESVEEIQNFTDENLLSSFAEGRTGGNQCFELEFPVDLTIGDDVLTFEDEESLKAEVKAYIEENGRDATKPSLVFPINITKDGESITINSDTEFDTLREECPRFGKGRKGKHGRHGKGEKCFTVNFPLTIVFPDGSSVEVADREAAKEAKIAFKEANPDSEERPSLQYPLDVTLEDGSTSTVESEEALKELAQSCRADDSN